MQTSLAKFLVVAGVLARFQNGNGYMIGNNPYHRAETLDPEGKYQVEWLVDWASTRITFNVTVETKGFVSFGVASDGRMLAGGDVVIGGVKSNGRAYFSDRHAVGGHVPVIDQSQDWTLHSARESATHTYLSFSRPFDTCDPDDYPITNNKVSLVWSYGDRDMEASYIYTNKRGSLEVYLLDTDYTPRITRSPPRTGPPNVDSSNIQVWTIPRRLTLPATETSYLCTMHKAPSLSRRHQVIGFEAIFETEETRNHVHHLIVYKCIAPPGQSAQTIFDPFVGDQHRQSCLAVQLAEGPMPTHFCSELYTAYGAGMRAFFTPPNVGLPFGESRDEYYVAQVHYNNPNLLTNVRVDMRLELFYTSNLRPNEGGILIVGHDIPGLSPSLLIPPKTPRQRIYGHCSEECTRRMFPANGITVYGFLLHSHNTGRQLRLHHFRNNQELPWIASDNNFNFNYQTLRPRREVRIMPGDRITMDCVDDSTQSDGTVVGGFAVRQEMCLGFLLYHSRIQDYGFCRSGIESPEYRQRILGVGNITWDQSQLEFIVESPNSLRGLTIKEVSDKHVSWTREKRQELQRFHLAHPHVGSCSKEPHARRNEPSDDFSGPTAYPFEAREYREPTRKCPFSYHQQNYRFRG